MRASYMLLSCCYVLRLKRQYYAAHARAHIIYIIHTLLVIIHRVAAAAARFFIRCIDKTYALLLQVPLLFIEAKLSIFFIS